MGRRTESQKAEPRTWRERPGEPTTFSAPRPEVMAELRRLLPPVRHVRPAERVA